MPSSENKRGLGTGFPTHLIQGINEDIRMNTWHFLYVIREMQLEKRGVKLEHPFIALSFSLALFLARLPSDFKDYLGIEAKVWEWLSLTFTILSFTTFIVLLAIWLKNGGYKKEETPEEILEKVKKQMAQQCEELAIEKQNLSSKTGDAK